MKVKTMKTKAKKSVKGIPVVVCSNNAVLFGRVENPIALPLRIKGARQAYYWKNQGGHCGLANSGPNAGSRVGDSADLFLHSVACVIECSAEGAKAWDSYPVTTK